MKSNLKLLALAVAAACAPGVALATNGYFSHGEGVKAQGMGGVGIALPQDAIAAATNPAGMAFVGDRFDLGPTWFRPSRSATIGGMPDFGPGSPASTAPTTATASPTTSFPKSAIAARAASTGR
ncbi:MAG: hypothetical protein LW847_06780 [Burkholderiales bacterium]|jgi:hypothetical protein|nr:hypothetical protein [Burkholderiales bacterium]